MDDMDFVSMEDRAAASAVAALGAKRGREEQEHSGNAKLGRSSNEETFEASKSPPSYPQPPPPAQQAMVAVMPAAPSVPGQGHEIKPYPFFFYEDFSTEKDPDPLTPLTSPGRVPNFPAKMHSILSRADLVDIIAWMPHGRSWRVLKPREFEIRIIPTYFEHAKFSSFIRQANGWGFRRITQGRDRNSYYHPLFLRGLPHHCKKMKRPGVSQKQTADPDHEPDLYKISEMHPVPENAAAVSADDSILLHCTLQGGPKARMPIYSGAISVASKDAILSSLNHHPTSMGGSYMAGTGGVGGMMMFDGQQLTPRDQAALSGFQHALGASEDHFKNMGSTTTSPAPSNNAMLSLPMSSLIMAAAAPPAMAAPPVALGDTSKTNPLAIANQLAFANPSQMAAVFQASSAASQFAAGFAAATALSHQQFQSMLGSLVQQAQASGGGGVVVPGMAAPQQQQQQHQPMDSSVHAQQPMQQQQEIYNNDSMNPSY